MDRRCNLLTVICVGGITVLSGCGSGGTTEPVAARTSTSTPGISVARSATFTNSGSTNTLGYTQTITLYTDGSVVPAAVSSGVATKLFADLDAANPVSSLPQEFCAKSVSFGSSTYIEYDGSTSPDLQCQSTSAAGAALEQDVASIAQTLNLGGPRFVVSG